MSELVFPIYESYFFVMMYDMFSEPEKSPAQNIWKLYLTLNSYLSTEAIYKTISNNYYIEEIMNIYNVDLKKNAQPLKDADFIVSNYCDKSLDYGTLAKVALSTYNHITEPACSLISRDYLYKNFKRTKECLLNSCTSELLEL